MAAFASNVAKFFENPMGIVTGEIDASFLNIEIGIVVEANVTLAFPPASLAFYGRLSGTSFEMRVRRSAISTSAWNEQYLLFPARCARKSLLLICRLLDRNTPSRRRRRRLSLLARSLLSESLRSWQS